MSFIASEDVLNLVLSFLPFAHIVGFGQSSRYFKRLFLEHMALRFDLAVSTNISLSTSTSDNLEYFRDTLALTNSWITGSTANSILRSGFPTSITELEITCSPNQADVWSSFFRILGYSCKFIKSDVDDFAYYCVFRTAVSNVILCVSSRRMASNNPPPLMWHCTCSSLVITAHEILSPFPNSTTTNSCISCEGLPPLADFTIHQSLGLTLMLGVDMWTSPCGPACPAFRHDYTDVFSGCWAWNTRSYLRHLAGHTRLVSPTYHGFLRAKDDTSCCNMHCVSSGERFV